MSVTFPGARRPDRFRRVDASGIGISVVEWGDPDGPPVLLTHGGFDFAGTFDVFAPCSPPRAGGWWRGTSAGTATPIGPTSTAGRRTSATRSR